MRELVHEKLDVIVRSGALEGRAVVLDLKDHQRGLVWIDGRFSHVLPPGVYAYWTGQKEVEVEVVDAGEVRFEHAQLPVIARSQMVKHVLDVCRVERDRVGVLFIDGQYVDTLHPGLYAFWRSAADAMRISKILEETIRRFEPRLLPRSIKVEGTPNSSVDDFTLGFRISAVLNVDPIREQVSFDTVFVLGYGYPRLFHRLKNFDGDWANAAVHTISGKPS